MAAFTSKATGNWSSGGQTTWNEVGVPGDGDTATIGAHTVTVDVNTTIGTSPNDITTKVVDKNSATGSLIIATGVTFTVKGNIGGVNNSIITMDAGSSLIFDASGSGGTPIYRIINVGFQKLAINGTSGNRCTFSSVSGQTVTLTQNYTQFIATFCDFTRLASVNSITTGTSISATLTNCTFTSCGQFELISNQTNVNCIVSNNTFTSSTAIESLKLSWTSARGSGTRTLSGNVFDKIFTYSSLGFTVLNNVFQNWEGVNSSRTDLISQNLFATDGLAQAAAGMRFNNDVGSNYFVTVGSPGNPHYVHIFSMDGNVEIADCVFEEATAFVTDIGDCVFPNDGGSSFIVTVRNNIVLKNSFGSGFSSGVLVTLLGTVATRTVKVNHNTIYVGNGLTLGGVDVAESGTAHANEISELKSNIVWSDDNTGFLISRITGTVTGIITAAGADYNGRFNVLNGDNGRGYNDRGNNLDLWTGAPADGNNAANSGVDNHQVIGDPGFIDSLRNAAKWATARGFGTTTASAIAACKTDTTRIADLITYVRDGFKLTNGAFAVGHDGAPIGAMGMGSTTIIPSIQVGPPFTMLQNVIYALPTKRCLLFTDAITPTIQQSTDVAFTANVAVTLTGGQAELAGAFIRCTSATINVIVKVK